MKRLVVYSLLFVSLTLFLQIGFFNTFSFAQNSQDPTPDICRSTKAIPGAPSCKDGVDNSNPKDGKADYYGVDCDQDGDIDMEPDPSCISPTSSEKSDLPAGKLISCYNYCTFSDFLRTLNNIITFLITTLFIPTVVLLFIYAGFKYITAQGDPKKIIDLKKLIINIFLGMLLVLCSWLIVKVILTVLVKDSDSALQFLE